MSVRLCSEAKINAAVVFLIFDAGLSVSHARRVKVRGYYMIRRRQVLNKRRYLNELRQRFNVYEMANYD